MLTLIVTGGIATGKTSFCQHFLKLTGAETRFFDSDACVHELLTKPEIASRVSASLESDLTSPDGSLDRARTGALIFNNPDKRRKLEEILHPLVRQACRNAMDHARSSPTTRWFLADVPLFYETNFPIDHDLQIVIACGPATQRRRLAARNNLTQEQISRRLESQMPILEKIPKAHAVLWNGGRPESLHRQTEYLLSWLKQNRQN